MALVNCSVLCRSDWFAEIIGFKVAKSPPTRINARENPGPETGIPGWKGLTMQHRNSTNATSYDDLEDKSMKRYCVHLSTK